MGFPLIAGRVDNHHTKHTGKFHKWCLEAANTVDNTFPPHTRHQKMRIAVVTDPIECEACHV